MRYVAYFLFVVTCLSSNMSFASSTKVADSVYLNGKIYTSVKTHPFAEAVVVKDGRFIYVGSTEHAREYVGKTTQVHDLDEKMVLPGLLDAHTHPGMVAFSVDGLVMEEAPTKAILLKEIERMVKENPSRKVLIGGYWENKLFDNKGPTKEELDRIESSRPVILYDAWAHSVWANSKAFEIAGIDEKTRDPIPGLAFYQRDETGKPSGWVTESAASSFVSNFQEITPAVEEAMMGYLEYLRSVGITTLLDAGNFGWDDEFYALISKWDKEGRLPIRYHGAYTLFLPEDYDNAVSKLLDMRAKYRSDRVRINTLKLFLDGVIETRTADMSVDYKDTPGNNGHSLLKKDQITKLIIDLHKEELDMHVHAVGNNSIKMTLDAVEEAQKKLGVPLKSQVTICHLEVMNNTDANRFKDLGVIASFTPHWHGSDSSELEPAIGRQSYNMMRAQPMISDGAIVTFSSDITDVTEWKTDRANPFLGMQVAHNKQDIDGGKNAVMSEPRSERLSLDALIMGYTKNAAIQLGLEDDLGSIEVGKRADFIILDRNLFEVDRYEISKVKPLLVINDGLPVFSAEGKGE